MKCSASRYTAELQEENVKAEITAAAREKKAAKKARRKDRNEAVKAREGPLSAAAVRTSATADASELPRTSSQPGTPAKHLHMAAAPAATARTEQGEDKHTALQTCRDHVGQTAAPPADRIPQTATAVIATSACSTAPNLALQPELPHGGVVSDVGAQRPSAEEVSTAGTLFQPAAQRGPVPATARTQLPTQHHPVQRAQSSSEVRHERASAQAEQMLSAGAAGLPALGQDTGHGPSAALHADAHLLCPITKVSPFVPLC